MPDPQHDPRRARRSGRGDTPASALQVAVGIGTLAGSTIMLLTIAWGGSLLVGRCDIERVRRFQCSHPAFLVCTLSRSICWQQTSGSYPVWRSSSSAAELFNSGSLERSHV